MANAEIMVTQAEHSPVRLERAIAVLEVAAFRLAAEFGADHPQAKAAMVSLAAAKGEYAGAAPAEALRQADSPWLAAYTKEPAAPQMPEEVPDRLCWSASMAPRT
jgi:hypothetical protein